MSVFDKRTASVLATILLFLAAGVFVYGARKVLVVFVLAIFFAYLLEPAVAWLQRRTRVSRGSRPVAILEVYVILGAIVGVLGFWGGPLVLNEVKGFVGALPGLLSRLSSGEIALEIGSRRGWSYQTQFRLEEFLANHSSAILSYTSTAISWLAQLAESLVWIILVPILAIFFLKDGRSFALEILDMMERRRQKRLLAGIEVELHEMVAHYIRAQIILAALSVAAYILVLSLLRVPYALALGCFAGILEFIPILGPAVAAVSIIGVAYLSNYHHLIVVGIFLLAWRLVQDYFTSPHIMSRRLRLHPLAVILAVLVGGELAGVLGVFLSIPVAAGLRIIWTSWRRVFAEDRSSVKAA